MKIVYLSPELKDEWNWLVDHSDDAWLFHRYEWLALTEKVYSLKSKSFLLEDQGKIVGIFPLQQDSPSRQLNSLYRGTGGPAVINNVSEPTRLKYLSILFNHAQTMFTTSGNMGLEVLLPPMSRLTREAKWGVNPLLTHGYSDTSTYTWIVNLNQSLEEIQASFSRNAKREISEAIQRGYTVKQVDGRRHLSNYYNIHCETYRRTEVTPHPKEYFANIFRYIQPPGNSVLWAAVDRKGHVIAYTNIAVFKKHAMYWTTCCKTDHYKNGVYYLLLWEAIKHAKQSGCATIDCAEAFPDVTSGKLKGLSDFKSKFGGELHRYYKGQIILRSQSEWLIAKGDWFRASINLYGLIRTTTQIRFKYYSLFTKSLISRLHFQGIRLLSIKESKPEWGLKKLLLILFSRLSVNQRQIFLDNFKKYLNYSGTVIATSSGRAAIKLGLKILKEKAPTRKKVLLSTYNCRGVIEPIIKNKLVPILVDVDKWLNIDASETIKIIKQDPGVLAVIVAHIGGARADIDHLREIAHRNGVFIIEDVCQALGLKEPGGQYAGTVSDMSVFSFGLGKNLIATAGGALLSNVFANDVKRSSQYLGEEREGLVKKRAFKVYLNTHCYTDLDLAEELRSSYGFNAMSPIDAYLLNIQLSGFPHSLETRKQHARLLTKQLSRTRTQLKLPPVSYNVFTKFPLMFNHTTHANLCRTILSQHLVETESMYTPLHLRHDISSSAKTAGKLWRSEDIFKNVFNVPVRASLTQQNISRLLNALSKYEHRSHSPT